MEIDWYDLFFGALTGGKLDDMIDPDAVMVDIGFYGYDVDSSIQSGRDNRASGAV